MLPAHYPRGQNMMSNSGQSVMLVGKISLFKSLEMFKSLPENSIHPCNSQIPRVFISIIVCVFFILFYKYTFESFS